MKIELEQADMQAIAEKVRDILKPHLVHKGDRAEEIIFDVPGLCEYLKVSEHWIHERTHLKQIPYFKLSNKQLRFRKTEIDKWLDSMRTPAFNPLSSRAAIFK